MRMTCVLCVLILVLTGICGGIYAFSGFNLLYFLSFNSDVIYRSFLAIGGISALYTIYSLIVFKPFKGLK